MISIIVAIAENLAIGKNNDLLWHLSDDLKRFRQITSGHTVIMGKRTCESLPHRPLPNRTNIVVTDIPNERIEGCEMAYSIAGAIEKCNSSHENFVIGGASLYRQFLPFADRLYLTRVHKAFEGDVYFPEIDFSQWKLISGSEIFYDTTGGFSYRYEVYDRIH